MEFEMLKKTPIFESLSSVGKRIFQPNGIFYWTGRAKNEAEINATIGTAVGPELDIIPNGRKKALPYYLPELKNFINIDPERLTSYAPIAGIPPFRELWKKWIIFKGKQEANMPSGPIDASSNITTPVVCNGITNAIYITSRMFLEPGESIICPNKRWGNYNSVLTMQNELKIESFQFFKNAQFNLEGMMNTLNNVSKIQNRMVLILNFPNNPTGYCPTPDEIQAIVKALTQFCQTHQKTIVVLCDDAYEGYTFSEKVAGNSIFYELLNQHELLIPLKLDGTSKEMLMYGGRIAGITLGIHPSWIKEEGDFDQFNTEWINKVQGMVRSTISNSNHFCQEILVDMMKDGFEGIVSSRKKVIDILDERYKGTVASFEKYNHTKMTMDPAGGGFFVFLNIEGIPADKFADHLLVKYKVGTFPIVNPKEKINGIRVAFCSIPIDQIDDCFHKIQLALIDFN
ncbi:Histidinol-phosphate aminotransferase [Candidatus Lokiarchaeum ossiferum]|uniref:Histidinol-phosphate aminotransferase n=1 Tax=Candidatus Lokiarchaeum ossiferum TaxID=2951803 RepID=A0ABY6HZS0_9ARCH|nr:Histidinol-phosphate aminotransferase [Candidatus Lokiarchaeum sp. B-35]